MININATIIIQAINFFIVYWMLRSFLFRPVVTIIDDEHAQKFLILSIIDQQKKSLEIQEKERKRNWFACQEYFSAHRPSTDKAEFFASELPNVGFVSSGASTDTIKDLVAETYAQIEEKIKNVH